MDQSDLFSQFFGGGGGFFGGGGPGGRELGVYTRSQQSCWLDLSC
jgi:hypothetical protein